VDGVAKGTDSDKSDRSDRSNRSDKSTGRGSYISFLLYLLGSFIAVVILNLLVRTSSPPLDTLTD
jgi:hypothetical protein